MSNFFLQKNFAKPGEIVQIGGDCVVWHTVFTSSDQSVAFISPPGTINVVWVWTALITEETLFADCENGAKWILLTATEDGNPFFMTKEDFITYTNYEWIFVFFLLLTAFLFRFVKRT